MALTYHITTFGCQMNSYDSELMEGILAAKGWGRAESEQSADVVLYNTCVVRDHAERRALARLAQLKALKAARPSMVIGVTGCMAQKDADALLEKMPHLDLVLGPRAIARLSPLLDAVLATGQPQVCVEIMDDPYPAGAAPVRSQALKALVSITFGCDNHCSYCIVPRTRGREISRPAAAILDEARSLAARGYKEITLLGQNVNSYRGEQNGGILDFGGLLRQVSAAAGEAWIRYITSHPRDCNDAHIAAVAQCANVCEHFHLPAQSGATTTLKRMRRGYTREHYLALAGRIRAAIPGAALTTDLIVGFPGETDEEYEQTLDLARRVRFDAAFMYLYSPRPGTPAAEEFPEQIPMAVKKERLARLIALQEQIGLEINRAAIGSEIDILIEAPAPRASGDLLGRTRGDKMVILPGPAEWIGRFMRARVTEANSHTLFARAE